MQASMQASMLFPLPPLTPGQLVLALSGCHWKCQWLAASCSLSRHHLSHLESESAPHFTPSCLNPCRMPVLPETA